MRARLIGRDPAFKAALSLARRAAPARGPVVIVGPTGSGKSLMARFIHEHGANPAAAFQEWSAGGVPATLLESDLLGVERGVATGVAERPGIFEAAGRGTICLSGLEDLAFSQQAILLRVIETGTVERIGGHRSARVQARLIATFQDPPEMLVSSAKLRQDLFYRLDLFRIELPPLCARSEDIPALFNHFLRAACIKERRAAPRVEPAFSEALLCHSWPGNVRELRQLAEAMAFLGKETLGIEDLPPSFWIAGEPVAEALRHRLTLEELKDRYVREVLVRVGGKKTEAARWLGISRKSLWERLKRASG
jgi:DNA-binding NtrC family response regulator